MIVAGEVSGDMHAGNLLTELLRRRQRVGAFGVGGENLARAGLECLFSVNELAHMGLFEVVRELPRLRSIMRQLLEQAELRRPQLAVLVDSPDFNLRLAGGLHRLGIPVVLFISPQLWAWRQARVKLVRRLVREVLCILPFEVAFYRQHGVPARFIGHPLVGDFAQQGLLGQSVSPVARRLALLPGSRINEVRQLLPIMVRSLKLLPTSLVDDAVIIQAPGMSPIVAEILAREGTDARLRLAEPGERRLELASCQTAWTASGTATLECALLDVPMIVGYRMQPLSFQLARLMVRVAHVGLVNLIAQARIAPELLQGQLKPRRLAEETKQLVNGDGEEQRKGLALVRERLGLPGASAHGAEALIQHLEAEAGA